MSERYFVIAWQLQRHLRGELSLDAFEEWLASYSWDCHRWNDGLAEQLTYAIHLPLFEWQHGDWTLEQLKGQWRILVQGVPQTFTQCSGTGFSFTFDMREMQ